LTKVATLPRNLYTGREFDGETGQYNYRARYYDPQAGRFLNTDPAEDDADNLYRYVGNNAPNLTDPSGMLVNTLFKTAGADFNLNFQPGDPSSAMGDAFNDSPSSLPQINMSSSPNANFTSVAANAGVGTFSFSGGALLRDYGMPAPFVAPQLPKAAATVVLAPTASFEQALAHAPAWL
jgi:RHS repeat-associated protein